MGRAKIGIMGITAIILLAVVGLSLFRFFDDDTVKGTLSAVVCLGGADSTCHEEAIRAGKQLAVSTRDGQTLLLLDGKKLSGMCLTDARRVRAHGILHDDGRALTPFRVETWCENQWKTAWEEGKEP